MERDKLELEKGHEILNQALFDAGETEGRLRRSYDIQKKSLDSIVKERDQLKLDLAEAERVIGFYGAEDTWIDKEIVNGSLFSWGKKHPIHDVSIIPYSIGESNGNFHCLGKKAREYLAKVEKNGTECRG